MAKRKRNRGSGSKLRPIKDYRDDEYIPYIFKTETGILQAWTIEPALTDGDVRQALRGLIKQISEANELPQALRDFEEENTTSVDTADPEGLLAQFILNGLGLAFQENGPLVAEDVVGVLKTINGSVGTWNIGMRQQGYLRYLRQFLGQMGVESRILTEEEVKELGLDET